MVDGPARSLGVEQVAGRVEGEDFLALEVGGAEQMAEQVVSTYTICIGSAGSMLLGC